MNDDLAPIRKIAICGGGTAGWMAAALLSRMLGTDRVAITLVESSSIATVGVGEATIPPIVQFNQMLGLDEREFMKATGATFKLGIEFVDWHRLGQKYMHPFGLFGADMHEVSFHHFWLRAVSLGMSDNLQHFNSEMMAAYSGRFARTGGNRPNGPRINYAYQFDAAAYAATLRNYAEKLGVERIDGKICDVLIKSANGDIEAIQLDDGRRVSADFFIDCTGFRALLIGEALGVGYDDWSHWLPCNRAIAVPSAASGRIEPFTRTTARQAGWQWHIPLQHRTGNGTVYSDAFVEEQSVLDALLANIGGKALADPNFVRFTAGRRKRSWVGNCLALGLASGFLEPLESTSIHLIQMALTWFLSFFPGRNVDPRLASRFNADMDVQISGIRDFIVAHYKLTERTDSPFWQHCRTMSIPDSLADRIDQFERRGEVFARQGELFKEANWFAVLYGQGVRPKSWHPMADRMPPDELQQNLAKIADIIASRVRNLPSHEESLSR